MSGEYRTIELVTGGANKRPGRIVELPAGADMPDYGHVSAAPIDALSSVYRFDAALADHVKATGSVRGFAGACKACGVHFDFDDSKSGGADALADVRRFVEAVCSDRLAVHIDDIQLWFSGNKGAHVLIRSDEIDSLPPAPDTPDKIKRLAVALAGRFPTFDRNVYDRTRLLRVANSRHSKSGLFKVPLLAGEVFKLDMPAIRALARYQRSKADACRQWVQSIEGI